MLRCSGTCAFCPNPCYRGEHRKDRRGVLLVSEKEMQGISNSFESPVVQEKGVSVVENIGEYEVVRSIFGKDKVRKVR